MRPKGIAEQLAARRERALVLVRQGQRPSDIGVVVGVTDRTVRRWQQAARSPKRRGRRAPGRPTRLSAKQVQRLEHELARGAFAHGYASDYWRLDQVAQLVWQLFAVRYHPSGVWHVLRRMGWSCLRPQRRPFGRTQKKWRVSGATLVCEDESGFPLVSPLKRTWAPRGRTPTVRTSLDQHERLNLLGGLRVSPGQRRVKLIVQSHAARCAVTK